MMLNRILGCDYQEWPRHFSRLSLHRDLTFIHDFEQRRLCLRGRAVYLVCEKYISEDRARFEIKAFLCRGIHRGSKKIAGQHVTCELDALKHAIQRAGEGLSQSCFANSGNAFNEQVSAREDSDECKPDDPIVSAYHCAESILQALRALVQGSDFSLQGLVSHVGRLYPLVTPFPKSAFAWTEPYGVLNVWGKPRTASG